MKRLWMIPTLIASLALTSTAFAVVDMKNANYADSWTDMTIPGGGYPLQVQRFYNSRTVFSGIFGFGWCSDFETNIEKTPEGQLKLVECGAGQEVVYRPEKFDAKRLDKTVDDIILHFKKVTPGATEQAVGILREQLKSHAELRNEWAKNAGMALPEVKKGVVYSAENIEVEKIVFDGTFYTRTLADGTLQKFDASGKIAIIYDKNGNSLKFAYAGESLREVVDNNGRKLSFTFFPNKRVKDITGPAGVKAEYKYKGEDLIEVRNMWKNKYAFDYDETHNLTKISFPDNTFKALSYNAKNDWVVSFTDRAAKGVSCTESYKYEVNKQNPKDNFWSTAIKKCGEEIKNEARFEFWHKQLPDGRKYLSRVLTKSMTDSLDVTYHPTFGRPTSVKRNGQLTTFDYFDNGLVREKTTASTRLVFEYKNEFNKVSKVNTEFLDPKGKVIRKRDTNFAYDAKANLKTAQNSDGQSVVLTYDSKGRIATILDQAKKEVVVKWDDKTGKPSKIERPGLGSIKLSYKPNGEINKVDSPDGPTVASQIAVTFNNLLDIIAPATSELSL